MSDVNRKIMAGEIINGYTREAYIELAVDAAALCLQWQATDATENGNGYPVGEDGDEYTAQVAEIPELVQGVARFVTENALLLTGARVDPGQAGHDLILTANGHGAGFWDRGLGRAGERLTTAAHALGEFDAEFALFGEHADGEHDADGVMWLTVMNTVVVNFTAVTGPNGEEEPEEEE